MNKRWLAGLLTAALLCCGLPRAAAREDTPVGRTVYLRVIGRDDTPEAQAEKLLVRDAVRAACPAQCADPEALLPLIQSVAASLAPCQVDFRLWTPGGGVPSAPTVYILLGEGAGHNWWGVLYQNALLWARIDEKPAERDEITMENAAEWDETSAEEAAEQEETSQEETAVRDKPNGEASASSDPPRQEVTPPQAVEFVWPFLTWLRSLLRL